MKTVVDMENSGVIHMLKNNKTEGEMDNFFRHYRMYKGWKISVAVSCIKSPSSEIIDYVNVSSFQTWPVCTSYSVVFMKESRQCVHVSVATCGNREKRWSQKRENRKMPSLLYR